MKFLRKNLDQIKPSFSKGGKFEKFHSAFDAFETFLFVPNTVTHKGSHIRDSIDLKRTMSVVIVALLPCLFFGMWNIGYQYHLSIGNLTASLLDNFLYGLVDMLPLIIVSYAVGLGIEIVSAQMRGHEVNEGFLVSGLLIPMIMPIGVPVWMVGVGTAFAVIIGKEVFGGTGMNIWNPALLARAFVFFAYPSQMSGDKVWVSQLGSNTQLGTVVDGFSGATPLAQAASGADLTSVYSASDLFMGFIPGSAGETSKFAVLIGAAILLISGIGSWRIMVAGVVGALAMGSFCGLFAGENVYLAMPSYYHLLIGGLAFGLVFMATDPVSASQTNTGKWIYGFMIGALVVIIRVFNPAYPEGVMLVILLMNTFAPLIDYYVVKANIRRRMSRNKVITQEAKA